MYLTFMTTQRGRRRGIALGFLAGVPFFSFLLIWQLNQLAAASALMIWSVSIISSFLLTAALLGLTWLQLAWLTGCGWSLVSSRR